MSQTQDLASYINEHGPSIGKELPFRPKSNQHVRNEVKVFDPSPRGFGSGIPTLVYYTDECDPEEVINTWVDANGEYVEGRTDLQMHYRIVEHGEEFREPSKERFGPFHSIANRSGETTTDMCPLCGGGVDKALATHLPDCEEA